MSSARACATAISCAALYGSDPVQLLLGGQLHPGGPELSPRLVSAARSEAVRAGLGERTSFVLADAEHLPVEDAAFDAALCECALSTIADQAAAVAEIRRALRPGGRVGIADVTLDRDRLPAALDTPIGRILCVAGARCAQGYERA